MKIFVYGDIGGHLNPFLESLAADVGWGRDGPADDTVVVQVGDLVHRGPHSDELVVWVDQVMRLYPKQWVQLVGNHEAHHLGGPTFGLSVKGQTVEFDLDPTAEKTLQKWWKSGKAHLAAAIRRDDGRDVLVTHAGLCRQTWATLGEPLTAADAAKALNRQDNNHAFAPGYLLGGYKADKPGPEGTLMPPGVVWASAAKEVYPSWDGRPSLFDQVHGHSGIYNWSSGKWWVDYSIQAKTVLRKDDRFSRWENTDGHSFICVDQALEADEPYFPIKPLIIEGEVLVP